MAHKIYWTEKTSERLLTVSSRKNPPKEGSIGTLIAKKEKLKVKIINVEPGPLIYFDNYFVVTVEILPS